MRVLHLSDLHQTERGLGILHVWEPVLSRLGKMEAQRKPVFDAVIISGDTVQEPSEAAYAAVGKMLKAHVLPLVGDDPAAVVLVPGNHDVNWTVDIRGEETRLDPRDETPPEESMVRTGVIDGARTTFRVGATYATRFELFQRFYGSFYSTAASSAMTLKRMDLLRGTNWSVHRFKQLGVSIVGLNSCSANDRYWPGASLDRTMLHDAGRWLHDNGCSNDRLIAVWHHGVDCKRGGIDRITNAELGALFDHGYRVGFHGHVHEQGVETREYVDVRLGAITEEPFVLIGGGSIGAGVKERPDAPNQFSIVEMTPSRIQVSTYELRRSQGRYMAPLVVQREHLGRRRSTGQVLVNAQTHIETHARHVLIDRDGIAETTVVLTGIVLAGELTLAHPRKGSGRILGAETAEARTGHGTIKSLKVRAVDRKERGIQYILEPDGESHFEEIRWAYSQSNAYALSPRDLERWPQDEGDLRTALSPRREYVAHVVRSECDVLRLSCEYAPSVGHILDATVHTEVEAQVLANGLEARYEPYPLAEHAVPSRSASLVSAEFKNPLVGHRCSLFFDLKEAERQDLTRYHHLLARLVTECRDEIAPEEGLVERLSREIEKAIRKTLGCFERERRFECRWHGYLWYPPQKRLLGCFGRIPHRGWSVRFRHGQGVVGSAFRFERPFAWLKRDGVGAGLLSDLDPAARRRETLWIQRVDPSNPNPPAYVWNLALPILAPSADEELPGPAIGAFGVGGQAKDESELMGKLAAIANRVAAERSGEVAGHPGEMLTEAISAAFWAVVRAWAEQRWESVADR